jgi:hypothetical protein
MRRSDAPAVAAFRRESGREVGLEHDVIDVAEDEDIRVDEEDLLKFRHREDAELIKRHALQCEEGGGEIRGNANEMSRL